MSDLRENEFDYFEELEIREIRIKDFYNLNETLDEYVEYLIYSAEADGYYRIVFDEDTELFRIVYFETYYTKFWNLHMTVEKFLKLKAQYFVKQGYEVNVDNEDPCQPYLDFAIHSLEGDLKDNIRKIESINAKFEENIKKLESQIEDLINNYTFQQII